ncbi:MAG: cyclase family protein [Chloroflexi bacterium]|nr:cyclase family protein [Chloroflexota bacterium]
MRIYDVSVGISPELPVWPGDPQIVLERVSKIEEGANANVSRLVCSVHIGTHIDAPIHFLEDGTGIDSLPLNVLIGRAYVIDLSTADVLDAKTLESAGIPPRTRRLLFKTRNSKYWAAGETDFKENFVGVDASGARWLARKKVQLVGVDYLSVAPFKQSRDTHRTLLQAGIVIVEGLNLHEVSQGRYMLYALPIKLMGSDGAPTRAILTGV